MPKDFVAGNPYQKQFDSASSIKAAGVSDTDWEKIKGFMPDPKAFAKEDIESFTVDLANDQIDRDNERFSDDVLKSFNKTLPGKGFLIGHSWGPPGKGLFYDSGLKTVDGIKWVRGKFYVLKQYSQSLIDHVNAGIWKWVSIGFTAPKLQRIVPEEDENKAFYEYQNKGNQEAEALEGSLVWLGAQYDAQIIKSLQGLLNNNQIIKAETLEIDQKTKDKGADMPTLKLLQLDLELGVNDENEVAAAAKEINEKIAILKGDSILDARFVEGVQKEFGKEITVDQLKLIKKDGDKYREFLVEETVKFGSLIKMVKEDEVEKEREFYKGLSLDRLEKELERFKNKYKEMNPGYSEIDGSTEDKTFSGEKVEVDNIDSYQG